MIYAVGNADIIYKLKYKYLNIFDYIDAVLEKLPNELDTNDLYLMLEYQGEYRNNIQSFDEFVLRKTVEGNLVTGKIRLDLCTACQLNCKLCFMRELNYGEFKCGYTTFNNFKKLIDNNPEIKQIEMSSNGEIFLNPDLVKILQYADEHKIIMRADNGVNFNKVSEEQLRALVDYKVKSITLSIDGGSPEVYSKYRQGGDFNTVINNLRKLILYKKEKNSKFPELKWQYILMTETEDDIDNAKALCDELGITLKFKLTWDASYVPKNTQLLKEKTGLKYVTIKEYDSNCSEAYAKNSICKQLLINPQFNWDGRLVGCCTNLKVSNLNIFKDGLKTVLKSAELINARKNLLPWIYGKKSFETNICKDCKIKEKIDLMHFNPLLVELPDKGKYFIEKWGKR